MRDKKFELKSDRFREARGGYSRVLEISCARCGGFQFHYQKDGPGPLLRLYLDRIMDSGRYRQAATRPVQSLPPFTCANCSEHLGVPVMYSKENRVALRLFQDSVRKKVVRSSR